MTPLTRSHDHALPEEPQDATQEQHGMRTIALRAGLAALALSVAVSGAAYAAVHAGEPSRTSGVEAAAKGTDGLGAEGGRSRVSVTPSTQKVTTETVDATDPHGSVQQESGDLSEGETKVATAGVDGVVRTTYEVTTVGGKEVSRTPVAQVVVTQKVDEVVLVGTGAAKKQENKPEAPAEQSQPNQGDQQQGDPAGSQAAPEQQAPAPEQSSEGGAPAAAEESAPQGAAEAPGEQAAAPREQAASGQQGTATAGRSTLAQTGVGTTAAWMVLGTGAAGAAMLMARRRLTY